MTVVSANQEVFPQPSRETQITQNEITWAIGNTRSASLGSDGISLTVLRKLMSWAPRYFTGVFDSLLLEGVVPRSWREGIIVPIRKPMLPPFQPSSYRPITITSVVSKVFEKILLQRLLHHLHEGHHIPHQMYGFLPGRSTMEYLSTLHHDIILARQKNQFILLVSLDLQRAYEHVPHDLLFRKLRRLHVPALLLTWIQEFLNNRTYRVRWKTCLSSPYPQTKGLPQGAVLSPILFALFVHDIVDVTHPQVRIFVYADDISILSVSHHRRTLCSYLTYSLSGLTRWAESNGMSFTLHKSGLLDLSRRHTGILPGFFLHGSAIPRVSKLKIVGVIFQEHLEWKAHLTYLQGKVMKRISFLRFFGSPKWGLKSRQLMTIMSLTILPILTYGATILFSAPEYYRVGLERLHSAALRACSGVPRQCPIRILRCISGLDELESTVHMKIMRFVIQHESLGRNSPIWRLFQNREALDYFRWGTSHIPLSYLINIHESTGLLDVDLIRASPFIASAVLDKNYRISLDDFPFQSKDLSRALTLNFFREFESTLDPSTLVIGTDAARRSDVTAIGVVSSSGLQISQRLRGEFSIFAAEAMAIVVALSDVSAAVPSFVLCSDSLSVLSALKAIHRKSHPLLLEIHQMLQSFVLNGGVAHLIWVPGHSGIPINESADKAAGQGIHSMEIAQHKVPWPDMYRSFCQIIRSRALTSWSKSHYSTLFPHLHPSRPWVASEVLTRRAEVLQQLRTNTLPLNGNLCSWGGLSSPNCVNCGSIETLSHFLLDCPTYTRQRQSLLTSLRLTPPINLQDLLDFANVLVPYPGDCVMWHFLQTTGCF